MFKKVNLLYFTIIIYVNMCVKQIENLDEDKPIYIHLDVNFYKEQKYYSPPKNCINQYKNIYCANCGEKGHVVKECSRPITSFGIIAFKVVNNKHEEKYDKNTYLSNLVKESDDFDDTNIYPKIKYLLIQRKDTMGYIDFIRGKYSNTNETEKYIKINTCLNEMTFTEKKNLLTQDFDKIWENLWINHNSKAFLNEYESAKKKYNKLDINNLVKNSKTQYSYQEFSFAKGRRNMKETNILCAEREFHEETGYDKSTYDFIKNYPIIQEEFMGTNKVKYRHTYYLVKMKKDVLPPIVDINDTVQTGEVKDIGWFTFTECLSLIRPYDVEKKNVLIKVNDDLIKMNFKFNCSNYYSNYVKWNYNHYNKKNYYHFQNNHSHNNICNFTNKIKYKESYEELENLYLHTDQRLIESKF